MKTNRLKYLSKRLIFSAIICFLMCGCDIQNKKINDSDNTGVVDIEGIPFKYIINGTGETVVVVGSADYYSEAFSKKLPESFKMIYIDGRQVIPTYVPSENEVLDLSTWADDLENIRQQLKLGKISVVGHSIHAQIAMEYAHKYPDNVKRLILLCGVPYKFSEFDTLTNEFWKNEADSVRKNVDVVQNLKRDSILKVTSPENSFAVSYDMNRAKYWLDPNYDASELIGKYKISPSVFNQLINAAQTKEEVIDKLKNVKSPILLVLGKYDFGIPYMAWEPIIEQIKVDYILMDNASHNPFTEEVSQKEFDDFFIDWMSKTK